MENGILLYSALTRGATRARAASFFWLGRTWPAENAVARAADRPRHKRDRARDAPPAGGRRDDGRRRVAAT